MTRTTPIAPVSEAPEHAEALAWLARRIRWERRLAELRESTAIEILDDVEVDEAA
jgi:hypothetical protein